jgi:hypothetical protein
MKPEKPKKLGLPKQSSGKPYDALLDPLPLPDVVESDSDTAWGLWQDSMQSNDETISAVPAKDQAYDDTVPLDLGESIDPPKSDF